MILRTKTILTIFRLSFSVFLFTEQCFMGATHRVLVQHRLPAPSNISKKRNAVSNLQHFWVENQRQVCRKFQGFFFLRPFNTLKLSFYVLFHTVEKQISHLNTTVRTVAQIHLYLITSISLSSLTDYSRWQASSCQLFTDENYLEVLATPEFQTVSEELFRIVFVVWSL